MLARIIAKTSKQITMQAKQTMSVDVMLAASLGLGWRAGAGAGAKRPGFIF